MRQRRRLLFYGPLMPDLARGLAAGIEAWGPWEIVTRSLDANFRADLAQADAALCYVSAPDGLDFFKHFTGPALNFSGILDSSPLPRLTWDNEATGRLAAEHFLERAYHQYAFIGYADAAFSQERLHGYTAALQQQAHSCESFDLGLFHQPAAHATLTDIASWLQGLPRPLALFAANDQAARRTVEAAQLCNRAVPEDIAILGCDDSPDSLLAPLSLSTIVPPLFDIGFHSVRLLSAALDGESLPADTRLAPQEVVGRASTATQAISDDRVATAVSWIREHLQHNIRVDDIADGVAMSRRALELAFAQHHQRSVKSEVEHQRIALAQRLLANPQVSLAAIAARCGFRDRQRFSVVFKRLTGLTPGAYAEQAQV